MGLVHTKLSAIVVMSAIANDVTLTDTDHDTNGVFTLSETETDTRTGIGARTAPVLVQVQCDASRQFHTIHYFPVMY